MSETICVLCGAKDQLEKAFFCYSCGAQVRCKKCGELIIANANNCIGCGEKLNQLDNSYSSSPILNSIKFSETKEERRYELRFTNEVGKEVKDVVNNLINSRSKNSQLDYNVDLENKDVPATLNQNSNQNLETIDNKNDSDTKGSFPHINDLEMRVNASEAEWILMYVAYESDFGKQVLSKDRIFEKYKEKRYTETRVKNFAKSWKSLFTSDFIKTIKENEYRITEKGLEKIKTLIIGKEGGKQRMTPLNGKKKDTDGEREKAKQSSSKKTGSVAVEEFELSGNGNDIISLESFFKEKKSNDSTPNRIVTIAYYISKVLKNDTFSDGQIDYAYIVLKLKDRPEHLRQIIINLKNKNHWFGLVEGSSRWKLNRAAELYVEKMPFEKES